MALIYPAPDSEQAPAAGLPPGERPHAPEITPPSGGRRLRHNLTSPETRFGRGLRAFYRGLVIFVSLVALGALAVYMALARPAEQQLEALRAEATQTAADIARANQDRDQAIQQRVEADRRAEEAQARLNLELTRIRVLRVTHAIADAQMAVARQDRAGAAKALTTAENNLRQAKPRLDQLNPDYAAPFENLFTLTRGDLERDLSFAAQDLERIRLELSRLDNALR